MKVKAEAKGGVQQFVHKEKEGEENEEVEMEEQEEQEDKFVEL